MELEKKVSESERDLLIPFDAVPDVASALDSFAEVFYTAFDCAKTITFPSIEE